MRSAMLTALAVLALAAAAPADAQQRPQAGAGQQQAQQAQQAPAEVTLVYEREVFVYRPAGRRDPFRALTDENEMGPRFEDLSLQGIIYSTGQGRSVALLAGREGRIYRVRVGDVVGNARVIEIGPLRVVMAVENFGVVRQEMLELRRNQGDNR